MPNEKIHRTITAPSIDVDGTNTGDGVSYRETVTVQWMPDCDVNLTVESEPLAGLPGEKAWAAGMTLSRQEINRLIKALRRARDAAYGRDE